MKVYGSMQMTEDLREVCPHLEGPCSGHLGRWDSMQCPELSVSLVLGSNPASSVC